MTRWGRGQSIHPYSFAATAWSPGFQLPKVEIGERGKNRLIVEERTGPGLAGPYAVHSDLPPPAQRGIAPYALSILSRSSFSPIFRYSVAILTSSMLAVFSREPSLNFNVSRMKIFSCLRMKSFSVVPIGR